MADLLDVAIPQHEVNGLDRPVEFGPQPQFEAGHLWRQTAFPCFSCLIVAVGFGHEIGLPATDEILFGILTDPTTVRSGLGFYKAHNRLFYTRAELQQHFHDLHFQCMGQAYEVILDAWYEALCREPPGHD